jgi:hypothetical protein
LRTSTIFILQQTLLLCDRIKEKEMSGAWKKGDEKCVKNFSQRTSREESTKKTFPSMG